MITDDQATLDTIRLISPQAAPSVGTNIIDSKYSNNKYVALWTDRMLKRRKFSSLVMIAMNGKRAILSFISFPSYRPRAGWGTPCWVRSFRERKKSFSVLSVLRVGGLCWVWKPQAGIMCFIPLCKNTKNLSIHPSCRPVSWVQGM